MYRRPAPSVPAPCRRRTKRRRRGSRRKRSSISCKAPFDEKGMILFSVMLGLVLFAALVDPSLFQDLHWRLIGPFRAGRVLAVSGVLGEPEHFYFGSVNGGVWETSDAGRTWQPIFDSQPIGSIGALAIAPSNPKVLYVGSGEADMRS